MSYLISQDAPVNLFDAVKAAQREADKMPLTVNQIVALRILRLATNGRYDIEALAGDANVKRRVAIMSALAGVKSVQARAGINALRQALYATAGVDSSVMTLAAASTAFILWARKHGDPLVSLTIEQARETIAVLARADGEEQFAREVLSGAWDTSRSDIASLMIGKF